MIEFQGWISFCEYECTDIEAEEEGRILCDKLLEFASTDFVVVLSGYNARPCFLVLGSQDPQSEKWLSLVKYFELEAKASTSTYGELSFIVRSAKHFENKIYQAYVIRNGHMTLHAKPYLKFGVPGISPTGSKRDSQ